MLLQLALICFELLHVAFICSIRKNILTSFAKASEVEEPPTPPPALKLRRLKNALAAEEKKSFGGSEMDLKRE
jgi:hypothetical protein